MQVSKEVKVMEQLDTHFVVAVCGSLSTKTSLTIVMEYFAMGSLQNVLQQDKLPFSGRIPMLLDIAKPMAYLHSQNIIHRDLKPGNVLVRSIDPQNHPMAKFVSLPFFITNKNKTYCGKRMERITTHNAKHRISDFGEARTVESTEASMTMTSGVGSPFFMAPELIMNTRHYTSAVDVYSFAIMAAQVMVDKLVYDAQEFDNQYGLFFSMFIHNYHICTS